MKIILTAVGTRGDIEPFLAIGYFLKEKGHQVICAFSERYRELTENCGLEFASLGKKGDNLFECDLAGAVMGGAGIKRLIALIKLFKLAGNEKGAAKEKEFNLYELVKEEQPDRILYHFKSYYPVLWECKNRGKTIMVFPCLFAHYSKGHTFIFGNNYGELLNKLSYKFYDFAAATIAVIINKMLQIKERVTIKQLINILHNRKFIYAVSPAFFQRPDYWKDNVKILGHHELKKTTDWKPEKRLTEFIEKHDKILFITFGSMLNPEPVHKTEMILEILDRNKIPAVINTASGGLIKPDNFNSELVYFVSQIPYDCIFPKMYAVIHHGGAGTTHLAIKYGCASMIIPHIVDQFVWNRIISDLGFGPKGIKISKINKNNLEPKILELFNNRKFKEKSEKIGNQMQNENFEDELYKTIIEE